MEVVKLASDGPTPRSAPSRSIGIEATINLVLDPETAARQLANGASVIGPIIAIGLIRLAASFVLFSPSLNPIKLLGTVVIAIVPPVVIALLLATALKATLLFGESELSFDRAFALILGATAWATLLTVIATWLGVLLAPEVLTRGAQTVSPTNLGFLVDASVNPSGHFLLSVVDVATALRCFLIIRTLPHVAQGVSTTRATVAVLLPLTVVAALILGVKVVVSS
jgi:hypothetical protein